MKDFLRQNGILLLLSALLLTVVLWFGSALLGGSNPVTNAANVIATPFRTGIARVFDWCEGVVDYVLHYDELHQELDDLRRQVAELEGQVRDAQESVRENAQLRQLLGLQAKHRDFDLESARVTARSTSNWNSTLTLNRGTNASVEAGDCVITETGTLVGIVSEVGLNWCTVSTIISTDIELGGMVTRTYSAGILQGDFTLMNQGQLMLNYLPDSAQLVSGDEVLTSGKGSVYPSGLVVGHVEGVFTDPSGITRYAVVQPACELDSLIEVFIIKDFDIVE